MWVLLPEGVIRQHGCPDQLALGKHPEVVAPQYFSCRNCAQPYWLYYFRARGRKPHSPPSEPSAPPAHSGDVTRLK